MSIFSMGEPEGEAMMDRNKCKRDFEAEIAREKSRQQTTARLLDALHEYLDVHGSYNATRQSFNLAEMLGRLELEEKQERRNINALQEQWENEK